MNQELPSDHAPGSELRDKPPAAPAKPSSTRAIVFGFLVGAVSWVLGLVPRQGYDQIRYLIVACFVVPFFSAVLTIIPRTRRFGLGLLLASGLGWLVLGAICGGLFRQSEPAGPGRIEQKSLTVPRKNPPPK